MIVLAMGLGLGNASCDLQCKKIYYSDSDGDGFGDPDSGLPQCKPFGNMVENGDDCDDTDPAVYPGAEEACDGVDSDCDGIGIQEILDLDRDGYSECDGDCAPEDPLTSPGQPERCNGIDDNCDGAPESPDYLQDTDDDGFTGCDGDCALTDPAVHPGAEEICNGIDDDCDGVADEAQDRFEPNDRIAQASEVDLRGGRAFLDAAFTSPTDPADYFALYVSDNEDFFFNSFDISVVVLPNKKGITLDVELLDPNREVVASQTVDADPGFGLLSYSGGLFDDTELGGTYVLVVRPVGAPSCDATYQLDIEASD